MEHKRVRVNKCHTMLQFVKAIMEVTGKSLFECKKIADTIRTEITLLNESSITPQQWEEIVSKEGVSIEWEYV